MKFLLKNGWLKCQKVIENCRFQMISHQPSATSTLDLDLRVLMIVFITCPITPLKEDNIITQNKNLVSQYVRAQVCTGNGEMGLLFKNFPLHHLESCKSKHHGCYPVLLQIELIKAHLPPYPWAQEMSKIADSLIKSNQSTVLNVLMTPRCITSCNSYQVAFDNDKKRSRFSD